MSYTDLDGMIAAIADEHLNRSRWAVLLLHMLLGPLLQAWQTLHTIKLLLLCCLPIAMLKTAVCLAVQLGTC